MSRDFFSRLSLVNQLQPSLPGNAGNQVLVFEQTRVAGDLWLPKRMYMKGAGRLGLILRIAIDQEITWGNYRRFQVDSKIVPLVFEQTRVADDLWLPKRMYMKGAGRLGLIKRIAMEQEITWSNYRRFQVDSKIVPLER